MIRRSLLIGSLYATAFFGEPVSASAVEADLASLPADFVENRGQWKTSARFVAWRGAVAASLEPDAIRLHVGGDRASTIALAFEGAVRGDVALVGEGRRDGTYNFFLGSDRTRWRSKVPAYGGVLYRGLYEDVDLRVREHGSLLEYDVLLAPGADLEQVIFRADGASKLTLESDGSLTLHTARGSVRQTPPSTWQVSASGEMRPVTSRFRLIDAHRFGFEVPGRDPDLSLMIDPGLEWSTFLGGGGREEMQAVGIAKDGTGDVIVAGKTFSADFPATGGGLGASPLVAFVARLNATGTGLVYATLFGSTNGNVAHLYDMALDASSAPILVGETNGADFPTTPGSYDPTFNEPSAQINRGWDAFVTRFDASGSQMVFSTYLGAAPIFDASRPGSSRGGDEGARAVAVDTSGSVIVAGYTSSEDFPTTPGAYDRTLDTLRVAVSQGTVESRMDAFVTRFSPTGTQLTYSTYLGGQSDDVVRDIAVSGSGLVTLVGTEAPIETFDAQNNRTDHGTPFPTTPDAVTRTHLGASDAFLARLSLDGAGAADLKYSTIFGGFYIDEGTAVALDSNDPESVTIVGDTRSWDFPTTAGTYSRAPLFLPDNNPNYAGFLARFRVPPSGGALVWSTLLTGGGGQIPGSVVIDPTGDIVVAGSDTGGFPTTERSYKRVPASGVFVARFSGDGKQLLYSTYLEKTSGLFSDVPKLASTGSHGVIVAGQTLLPTFPTTAGAFDRLFGNNGTSDGFNTFDGFVAKLGLDPNGSTDTTASTPTLSSPANGATFPLGSTVTFDWTDVADPSGVQSYELAVNMNAAFLTGFGSAFPPGAGFYATSGATAPTSQEGVFYWRVRTLDGANNFSPWSEVRRFTLGPSTWTNFAAAALTPNGVVGGNTVQGQVHIQNFAPAGGQVYTLTSSRPSVASVPASVTVPAGAASATFTVTTSPVAASTPVQITVWSEGNGDHPVLWVDPAAAGSVTLASLTVNPASVTGGSSATGTALLSAAAPAGGQVVTLSSSNASAASVPASITVPAGATSTTFTVSTSAVASAVSVTLTGSSGGTTRTAVLTVNPAGGAPAGFKSPTANGADSGGDGNGFETTPGNAHAADAANAVDNNSGTGASTSCTSTQRDRHRFFNYGLGVGTGSSVQGIEVRLDARVDSPSNSPRLCVQLSWNGGASWTTAKATPTLGTSTASYVLGGAADTWGRTWTPAELSDANFRVRVITTANSTNRDFSVDWVPVSVTAAAGTPDTTPPTVAVDSPAAGATVSGTTSIAANASDNVGVTRVDFLVDGTLVGSDTTSPYAVSWSTTTASNGSHTLTAKAFDAANNQTTSAPVGVTVSNVAPPADTTAPTVSITAPAAGASVGGTVTISASASDNVGVTRVEFLVDSALIATDTTSPYSASWNTTAASNGAHTLAARAFDAANNQATSASVGVTVSNTAQPTLTVTATGRGGERVRSSPAGIDVAVGQSQSATFPVGTSITLSATNSRDVIWSGICSSNGQKTKTCTFTLNATASETANVQ